MVPAFSSAEFSLSMLIAHLITDLSSGGAQRQLQQLIVNSDKRRFRHVVISLVEDGAVAAKLQESGIEVHCMRMGGARSPWGFVRLICLLRGLRPDALHCWLYHACLLGSLGRRMAGVRCLLWGLRSANPSLRGYKLTTRIVVRVCAALSFIPDVTVVNSETSRTVHEKWGYKSSRMMVIPNGIDVEQFHPDSAARTSVRRELGTAPDSMLVGMIARYHSMKDHRSFLLAASLVSREYPGTQFVLVGDGLVRENVSLLQSIQENGIQGVTHLLGSRSDIARLTAALDVACLSSWSESFPNVILEAMACGVPCVATAVGDCVSIVGDTGKIVAPRDPLSMAAAIGELIVMPQATRDELGRRARQRVTRFSLVNTVTAYEDLYKGSAQASAARFPH